MLNIFEKINFQKLLIIEGIEIKIYMINIK